MAKKMPKMKALRTVGDPCKRLEVLPILNAHVFTWGRENVDDSGRCSPESAYTACAVRSVSWRCDLLTKPFTLSPTSSTPVHRRKI